MFFFIISYFFITIRVIKPTAKDVHMFRATHIAYQDGRVVKA